MAVAIGAIAGGAVGNVIDRVRFGRVVDFIHAHVVTPWGDFSWYVFNVADAAIVCGVAVLVLESVVSRAEGGRGTRADLIGVVSVLWSRRQSRRIKTGWYGLPRRFGHGSQAI